MFELHMFKFLNFDKRIKRHLTLYGCRYFWSVQQGYTIMAKKIIMIILIAIIYWF